MNITSDTIASTLLSLDGNLSATRWQAALHRQPRPVLEWLETLDLVEWRKVGRTKRRMLVVPVEDAVEVITNSIYTPPEKKQRKEYDNSSCAPMVRVVSDPTNLFRRGAEFPAAQVFGNSREKPVQPGELPLGIVLEDEKGRQWTMTREGLTN